MQRMLVVVAVLATLVIGSSASQAQNTRQEIGARKGPVAKLVELERRKNEWLRQRFAR